MKRMLFTLLGILLCCNIAAANSLNTGDPFAAAQGKYAVGTTFFTWNANDKDDNRYIGQIWYPAENTQNAKKAGYLPDSVLKSDLKSNPTIASLASVTTGAMLDTPLLGLKNRYPVLIYSPGLGLFGQAGTFFFEYLSSRGFIVVAINHPGSSLFTEKSGGSFVPLQEANYDDAQVKVALTKTRATELSAALDALVALNATPTSLFFNRIDTTNAGVFGHSIGGRSAFRAAALDKRFKAAADLDGSIEEEPPYTFTNQELLMAQTDVEEIIKTELAAGNIKSEEVPQIKKEYNESMANLFNTPNAKSYLFYYRHTRHANYTDMPILFKNGEQLGSADGTKVLLSLSHLLDDFFTEAFYHPKSSLKNKYFSAKLMKEKNTLR